MIGYKPGLGSHPTQDPRPEMVIYDDSQVSAMLVAARSTRLEALLHVAVATGMRQMELLGLMWTDIDWAGRTVKVQRQLAGDMVFAPPKTKFGVRIVAIGDKTIEVLRAHMDRQQIERQFQDEQWRRPGWCLPTPTAGQ